MTDVDFGAKPDGAAPAKGGPWLWVGGDDGWVQVVTDTGDGVPESLDLGGDTSKLKFDPAEKRASDGKWTDGPAGTAKKVAKVGEGLSDADLLKERPWTKNRGVGASGVIYTDEAELNAYKLLDSYAKIEPGVTSDLSNAAKDAGGRMEGLEWRLKGQESLARKIEQKSASKGLTMQAYTEKIGDALRYTMILPHDQYGEGTQKAIDMFRKDGHEVEVENTWTPGASYKGINTNMKKNGAIFEVQFHTQESFDLKMKAHVLYELARDATKSEKERAAATKKMADNAAALPEPSGAGKIH